MRQNISASSRPDSWAADGPARHPTGRVPLVGYVGAGAIAHFYADAQGPFDEVDAPDASGSHSTVAVQIRGHSLGALVRQLARVLRRCARLLPATI